MSPDRLATDPNNEIAIHRQQPNTEVSTEATQLAPTEPQTSQVGTIRNIPIGGFGERDTVKPVEPV